jgi:hypothetical protein
VHFTKSITMYGAALDLAAVRLDEDNGDSMPSPSSQNGNDMNYLETLGVSVAWLQNGFLNEVIAAGFDGSSSIHDIEPGNKHGASHLSDRRGVIREKGRSVKCPMDGQMGASYVHSLMLSTDHQTKSSPVGPACLMLSYGWAYSVGDIIDTLVDYCTTNQLEPSRTYVWICALCVNQHRICGSEQVSFEVFQEIFNRRVTGIGHLLAMMSPWHEPLYLTRIWCIFELFTAHTSAKAIGDQRVGGGQDGVRVTLVMPPRERQGMTRAIIEGDGKGIDQLYMLLRKHQYRKQKQHTKRIGSEF